MKQEELKFKNRQIGAAGFVANKIMENMINKPKLDTVGKQFYETADMTITVKRQETLEEAAERIAYDSTEENRLYPSTKIFIKGANWQAERMYSEEEVKNLTELFLPYYFKSDKGFDDAFKEWFEEFKKK
jgi:hypothetical protein